jgi:catechol 2,3-dioxygenase-like lactoylglutathione lyase family enzyme
MRLDHVVLAVSDWDRSMAFCRDVGGAQVGGAQVVGAQVVGARVVGVHESRTNRPVGALIALEAGVSDGLSP